MTAPTDTDQTDTEDTVEEQEPEAPKPATKDDGTPYTAADIEALQNALKAARKDARAAKRHPEPDQPNVDDVAKQASAAATGKWKPLVVKAHARTAFVEAGLALPKGDGEAAMSRVLRMLDLDDLDVTDDGHVEGLREQVEDIRRDFPELFTTARHRPGRVDAADKPGQVNGKPKSSSELIAAALLGGR